MRLRGDFCCMAGIEGAVSLGCIGGTILKRVDYR
jgi:hypothetical protein